jgi:hypothetical protein
MGILSQLTVVGKVTKQDFEKRYDEIFPDHDHIYKIVVIEDKSNKKVIGCGTIFFEKKFLRQTGTVNSKLEEVLPIIIILVWTY